MDVLILLVSRPRELVSRQDIIDHVWGKDVFVDVETGVNTVIRKVRQALRDPSDRPVFVETVPGRGYRFIASVEGPKASARVTLAVLPFENIGADPSRAYLAAGLTEETSATLAQIDPARLSVRGRASHYDGRVGSLGQIARDLAVDYLVASTLRAEGLRVRVTSTLIRTHDQEHVWSQSFEREELSVLGLQQELSVAIAEQIRVRLAPDRPSRAVNRQTVNQDAYDAYLRGRHFESQRTPHTNALAIEQYLRATTLDPDYALGWSRLAYTFTASVINGDARPSDVIGPARRAAAQAMRVNPDLAESQFVFGYVNWLLEWDWPKATAALRVAARLDPSSAVMAMTLGHLLSQRGQHEEAAAWMHRARELEPLEAVSHALSSQVAYQARDYAGAIEHARRATLIDSRLWIGPMQLAQAYEQIGEIDLALEVLKDASRLSGGNSKALSLRGYLLARSGRTDEARELLSILGARSKERYLPPYAMALVHAGLQDREAVFEWLGHALLARDVHLMYLGVDAKWDPYRNDERLSPLIAQCGIDPAIE